MLFVCLVGGVTTVSPRAQAPADQSAPTFEAASVKPSAPGQQGQNIRRFPGGRVTASNMPLRDLIRFVFQVQDFQLEEVPGWAADEHFDIVAKAAGDPPPVLPGTGTDPLIVMLRSLVVERFKLQVHRETKELPIYALVVAKPGVLGPQLQRSTTDCQALAAAQAAAARGQGAAPPPPVNGRPVCGVRLGPGVLSAGGFPLSQIAGALSRLVQRQVVDRTGLTEPFDLEVHFTPDASQLPPGGGSPGAEPAAFDPNGPSLFTALQEQLGLKLESTRAPTDVIVVDHVERPAAD